jgi:hypothetical protein
MTLSFLEHGVTQKKRAKGRKVTPALTTWEGLIPYFKTQLKDNPDKLIRETQWATDSNPEYPLEARQMFGNANVPMGYFGGTKKENLVKSVPCSSIEQGKKQLNEFIEGLDTDVDVQRIVAKFMKDRRGFDTSTIPSNLLGGV